MSHPAVQTRDQNMHLTEYWQVLRKIQINNSRFYFLKAETRSHYDL